MLNLYAQQQLLPLLDLTSLNIADNEQTIIKLCQQALSAPLPVASVCIYPKFLTLAREQLINSPIKLTTVSNFPSGNNHLTATLAEIKQAITDGADEIDMVMPYQAYLLGKVDQVKEFINACKQLCGERIILKVILETGALQKPKIIAQASRDAISAGADFIKTSTGKHTINATLEAAEIMLTAIRDSERPIGFKAAGGIRNIPQALSYLALASSIMGENWPNASNFRIGASSLINQLINGST